MQEREVVFTKTLLCAQTISCFHENTVVCTSGLIVCRSTYRTPQTTMLHQAHPLSLSLSLTSTLRTHRSGSRTGVPNGANASASPHTRPTTPPQATFSPTRAPRAAVACPTCPPCPTAEMGN